jgi:hypothetical protein
MKRLCVLIALGACSDPPTVPPDAEVLPSALPERLSEAGLYTSMSAKTVSPRLHEFAPHNVLWSDGAVKTRWYQVPDGALIDSSDMNHWKFPVGTKFFKEFAAPDGKKLETRLIWHVADTGDREHDFLMGSYVWNDDESEAVFMKAGAENIRGTDHDAPAADTCWRCHVGDAGHILGLSALQAEDVSALPLSVQPGKTFAAPNAALGYLHANCGHCHNPEGGAWSDSHMILRLDVEETDATANRVVQSTVGVDLEQWIDKGFDKRIVAGDPAASALFYRISQRTMNVQMPPIATEKTDDTGIELIRAWIQSL